MCSMMGINRMERYKKESVISHYQCQDAAQGAGKMRIKRKLNCMQKLQSQNYGAYCKFIGDLILWETEDKLSWLEKKLNHLQKRCLLRKEGKGRDYAFQDKELKSMFQT